MKNQEPLPLKWVEKIFMELHGRFGNAFFDKFRIGELNADGRDIGVENAKVTWARKLGGTSPDRIAAALSSIFDRAPDCDLFQSHCVLKAEIEDYKAIGKKLTDEELEANKKKLEKINADLTRKSSRDWVKYWNLILDNPKGLQEITLSCACEALINLGHPYKVVNA